jgi:hypothetical protein
MCSDLAYQDERVSPDGCLQLALTFDSVGVVRQTGLVACHAGGRTLVSQPVSASRPHTAVARFIRRYWGAGICG